MKWIFHETEDFGWNNSIWLQLLELVNKIFAFFISYINNSHRGECRIT